MMLPAFGHLVSQCPVSRVFRAELPLLLVLIGHLADVDFADLNALAVEGGDDIRQGFFNFLSGFRLLYLQDPGYFLSDFLKLDSDRPQARRSQSYLNSLNIILNGILKVPKYLLRSGKRGVQI